MIAIAPDSQAHSDVIQSCKDFNGSEGDAYVLLVGISQLPVTEVSKFVKGLASVDEFYDKPQ